MDLQSAQSISKDTISSLNRDKERLNKLLEDNEKKFGSERLELKRIDNTLNIQINLD